MKKKIQYNSQEEREQIINENSDLFLIEVQNLFDGNFLIFSDEPIPERTVYTNVPADDIESLKQSIAELTILIATP